MLDVNILKKYGLDTGLEHDFSMKHGSLMLFGHPVETNLNDLLPAHSNGRTCGGGWPQLWQAGIASVSCFTHLGFHVLQDHFPNANSHQNRGTSIISASTQKSSR